MPPPPNTPTPHRFVKPSESTKSHAVSKSASSLRYGNIQTPQPVSSTKQFAATPRFTFGVFNRKSQDPEARSITPSSSSFAQKQAFQKPTQHKENIEKLSSDEDDVADVHIPLPSRALWQSDDVPSDEDASLPPPTMSKKRPLEQEHIIVSSSPPSSPPSSRLTTPHKEPAIKSSPSPPSTPPPLLAASKHQPRFRLPAHSSPPSTSIKARPGFVLPPASDSPPIPHASVLSSPHKRCQNFVPGGLASMVREWVIETSQPLYQSRHRSEREWDLKLLVEEAKKLERLGNGAVLIRAREIAFSGNESKAWILMGNRKQDEGDEGLAKGSLVGLRRPVWSVCIGDEDWGVAVEWGVL